MQRQGYTFPLDVGRKVLKPETFMKLWSLDDVKYIFDKKNKEMPTLINPGDKVKFYEITKKEYKNFQWQNIFLNF